MCGIGGILAKEGQIVPEEALRQLSQALTHRGPDDSGFYLSQNRRIGMVHRRLSFIDLSPSGRQPMSGNDGKLQITFNGEIYNYQKLRETLLHKGYPFKTHSDTEVILALYAFYPHDFLNQLRGMFAFGLWDEKNQTLLLARDRLGIKPLYYALTKDFFIFSSEVRAILATGLVNRMLCLEALEGYLSFGSVPYPYTIIEGIKLLEPATLFQFHGGVETKREYWHLSLEENNASDYENPEILREQLVDAVKSHLVSDVPVGVFLSGGVDSTVITAFMRQITSGEIQSFSIVFPDSHLNEAPYSTLVSKTFETCHVQREITSRDFVRFLPEILRAMDQPSVNGVNTFFVSKITRESGVKTALSGLGGDELFAGYPSFRIVPKLVSWFETIRKIPLGKSIAQGALKVFPKTARMDSLREFLNSSGILEAGYFAVRRLFINEERSKLLLSEQAQESRRKFNPVHYLEELNQNGGTSNPLKAVALLEMRSYMHNQLLRDSDVMGLAHGVEIRVPFLDHLLVEQVNAIPFQKKLTLQPKQLLISALQNKIPKAIYQRPKMGFTFPFDAWMRKDLCKELTQFFQDGPGGKAKTLLNWPHAQQIWKNFLEKQTHWSRPWAIFVLSQWILQNTP